MNIFRWINNTQRLLGLHLRTRGNDFKLKGRHDTIDDFIRKVFEQWLEWRDTISFIEEAYTKQSTRIEDYVKQMKK